VLVSYLHAGVVEQHHWMTEPQLLDAIAVGQVTPGPLLTTATFVGYFLGHRTFGGGVPMGIACGILATFAIFLPSFLLIALLAPTLDRLRRNPIARGALDGMNAAVVALIVVTAAQLAVPAFYDVATHRIAWVHIAIAVASFAMLLFTEFNATWLILGAGLVGTLTSLGRL
jgi:chromate transporter